MNGLDLQENYLVALKKETDDFAVEFEVVPYNDAFKNNDSRRAKINAEISEIDNIIAERQSEIDKINEEIERLTNHADKPDYTIAVASGVLCGLIDSFVVGEFDYDSALEKSKKRVEEYVESKAEKIRTKETVEKAVKKATEKAKKEGRKLSRKEINDLKKEVSEGVKNTYKKIKAADKENGTSRALRRAIDKLEKTYKLPSDSSYSGKKIGVNSVTHHLDDLAHHPTLLGLVAAVIGSLFKLGIFVNKDGEWHFELADIDKKEMLKLWIPIIISGVLTWILYVVKSKNKNEIDEKLPKPIQKLISSLAQVPAAISVLTIANNWLGHLASDMAGSKTSAGKGKDGMGIPGLFVSLLKELSNVPPFNLTPLPKVVDDIFSNQRFDMRHELALLSELGRQAVPVLLGDLIVRTFYFVRHLMVEIKKQDIKGLNKNELEKWKKVDWRAIIPFNNRTIARMMTIESGTFCAVDMADAAIRSAIKSGGNAAAFGASFILRVNFVGIGRFAIAIGADVGMGVKRQKKINERIKLMNEVCHLENAKVFYLQADMWISAKNAGKAIGEAYKASEKAALYFVESFYEIESDLNKIGDEIDAAEKHNPGLKKEILDILGGRL